NFGAATFLNRQMKVQAVVEIGDGTPLSLIVGALSDRAGLASGTDYSVSPLADIFVRGFAIGRQTTIKAALQQLEDVYFFDLIEEDDKLKAVLRGGSPSASITEDDLAAVAGEQADPRPKVGEKRIQETDLPRRVVLSFQSEKLDFQINAQGAMRMSATQGSRELRNTEYPIVLTEDEA